MTPDYRIDQSDPAAILWHLTDCAASFHPPLAARVDLAAYAWKLTQNAVRFEAWGNGQLVGLVAVYCNAPDRGTAFVSSVSVLPHHTGQGIARHLMQMAIDHVRSLGFAEVTLKVDPCATPAVGLYAGLGFRADAEVGVDGQAMTLTLCAGRGRTLARPG